MNDLRTQLVTLLALMPAAWCAAAAGLALAGWLGWLAWSRQRRLRSAVEQLRWAEAASGRFRLQASESYLERQKALIALTRTAASEALPRDEVLRRLLRDSAAAVKVARASVWLLAPDRAAIRCLMLRDANEGESSGQVVGLDQAPAYFRALETEQAIAVGDAREDPRTRELTDWYLRPLGIASMLDVPVYLQDRVGGVLCLEHVGPPRPWHPDEQMFGLAVANLVTLVLERDKRRQADQALAQGEVRYRRLLEVMPDAVLCYRDGQIIFSNPAGLRLFGASRAEQLLGTPMLNRIAPESLPLIRERMSRLAAGEMSLPMAEVTNLRLDGSEVRIEAVSTSYEDEGGPVILAVLRDVSARKLAEARLRENQRFIEQVAATIPDTLYVYDLRERQNVYVNRPFARLLGYDDSDAAQMGADFLTLTLHPDDVRQLRQHHRRLGRAAQTGPVEIEYRMRGKDGDWRWIYSRETLFRSGPDGQPWRILGVAQDVTARKRAEAALKASEERYRAVVEDQTEVVSRLRADGTVLFVNDVYCRTFGKAREELLGRHWSPVAHPEDLPHIMARLATMSPSSPVVNIENRVFDAAGEVRWMEFVNRGFFGPAGELCEIQSVGRDVTERRRAAVALRESEERFRELAAAIPECFWIADPSGNVQYLSPAFEVIFGRPRDILAGGLDGFAACVHPDDRERWLSGVARQILEGGGEHEFRFVRGDGRVCWVRSHAFSVRDEQGRVLRNVGYSKDVSAEREAQEALRLAAAEARKLALVASKTASPAIITDAEGRIEWVNEAFTRVTEFTLEEARGKKPGHLLQGPETDPATVEVMRCAEREGRGFEVEILNYSKSGKLYWLSVEAQPILDEQGRLVQFIAVQSDVTARKRAEEELRRREEWFRALVENAYDAITCYDETGNVTYVSPSNLGMEGRMLEDVRGTNVMEYLHPDDIPMAQSNWARLLAEPRSRVSGLLRARHADGSWRWVEGTASNLLDNPAVRSVVVNWRDVTERKEAEERLRESEERFRTMANGAAVLIWMCDLQGRCTWVNQPWLRFTGTEERDWLEYRYRAIVHPDDVGVSDEMVRQMVEKRQGVRGELRVRQADGSFRWVYVTGTPYYQGGEVIGFIACSIDISSRRRAEEERDRFFTLSADIIGMLRFDGTFVRVNPAFERLFAWGQPELAGRHFRDVIEPELLPRVQALFGQAISGGSPLLLEAPFRIAGGEQRWLSIVAVPSPELGLIYFVGRDVHETMLTQSNLERARQAAEAASAAKNEFLSRMSHELRTPLNAILGFAQILEQELVLDEQRDSVSQILRGGRHLVGLINDILDISRIEGGRLALTLEPVELAGAVGEVIDLMRPFAAERGVSLGEVLVPEVAGVRADRQRLKQALVNLLSNAVKYNREGGRVRVTCSRRDGGWRVAVTDEGEGIPERMRERLFNPFDRLGADRTNVEGTGLGLAIARGLVREMGGNLDFASQAGRGSTFWIDLLEAECPVGELFGDTPNDQGIPKRSREAVLLYIEDNTANRQLIELVMRQRPNWSLVAAATGEEGLREAARIHPSLVLLDVHLPDIPGEEVLRRLKSDPSLAEVPVVALSADATGPTQGRLRDGGAAAYLTKPINLAEFLEVVEKELSAR
jgi:PAS domain S-box-containing protein